MDNAQCDNRVHLIKVHFFYVIVILGLFIIFLATDTWTDRKNFTEYLTNAGTMVSLVLALLAIFYAFISNDSLSRSLGEISKVAEDVAAAKKGIAESLVKSEAIAARSTENAAALDKVSAGVMGSVATLETGLAGMATSTKTLLETVAMLPQRIEGLEKGISETRADIAASIQSKPTVSSKDPDRASAAEKSLKFSSLAGRFLLYACVLSHRTGKVFKLSLISEQLKVSSLDYVWGYSVALNASDVLNIRKTAVKDDDLGIDRIDSYLDTHTHASLLELINRKKSENPERGQRYLDKVEMLEAYFKEAGTPSVAVEPLGK